MDSRLPSRSLLSLGYALTPEQSAALEAQCALCASADGLER